MTKRERARVIFVLGCLSTLGPFSIDMYLPGFKNVAADLRTSIAAVGYSLTSYFIGISVGQIFYGPLIDRFGRKRPLLVGLALYVVAAVACAASPSIAWLVVARLFTALGACVGLVAGRAIVRDVFPANETASIFSALVLVIAVSPALAPSVGGLLAGSVGWRFIFIVLALFAGALFFAVKLRLSETKSPDPSISLRLRGIALQYLAVGRDPQFATYTAVAGLASAGLFAYIGGAPSLFLRRYGLTAEQFALVFALNASGLVIGSQVNRLALKRFDSRTITAVCVTCQIAFGALFVAAAILDIRSLALTIALIAGYLFFQGFVNPNATALALEPFDSNIGSASALQGAVQMLMGALATGLVSVLSGGSSLPIALTMFAVAAVCFLLLEGFRRRTAVGSARAL